MEGSIVVAFHVFLDKETSLHQLFHGILFEDCLVDYGLLQVFQEQIGPWLNVLFTIITRVVAEVGSLYRRDNQ